MKLSIPLSLLSGLLGALAHGGVKSLEIDGDLYWAYHAGINERFAVKSVAFSQDAPRKPFITDQTSKDMACGSNPRAPTLTAPISAGSEIIFHWNPWYVSHKGPILSYLAPYEQSLEKVDVNKLNFFKIGEKGLAEDGKTWAVDEMMAKGNISSIVIPKDVKPGKYVLRHELIALHYSTEDSLYHMKADKLLGPQHYIACFNIQITGAGNSQPSGVVFPGAYKPFKQEPGLYFDIWRNVSPYPIPGPKLQFVQAASSNSARKPQSTISPTGDAEKDKQYIAAIRSAAKRSDSFTFSVNNKHMGYGGNPAMTGPPAGSVPPGAVVKGAKWRPTENGLAGEEVL